MAGWPEHSPSSSGSSAPLPSHRRPPLPPPSSAENSVSTSSISFHRPFDSPPSGVRERTSRTISGRPDRLKGYFDVCNIACYKSPVVNRPVPSSCRADQDTQIGGMDHIRWPHLLQNSASFGSRYPQLRHFTRTTVLATPAALKPASWMPAPNAVAAV